MRSSWANVSLLKIGLSVFNKNLARFFFILIGGIGLTFTASYFADAQMRQESSNRFAMEVNELESRILTRMENYANALIHIQALFRASKEVTRESFEEFVSSMMIQEKYPGIQGLGYAIHLSSREVSRFETRMRRAGTPSFHVWPLKPLRTQYSSVMYLEPSNWRNQRAIGFDMLSESKRRVAMDRARDSGQVAMTGKVILVQESAQDAQPGFLVYKAFYDPRLPTSTVEERRKALRGYVYAPFRTQELFSRVFGDHGSDQYLHIELYDKAELLPEDRLYSTEDVSKRRTSQSGSLTAVRTLSLNGHQWTLRITALPGFVRESYRYLALAILLSGLAITGLLLLIFQAAQKREKAEIAHSIELDSLRRQRESILNSAGEGIYGVDCRGIATFMNPVASKMLGWKPEELMGRSLHEIIHHSKIDGTKYPKHDCPIYAAFMDGIIRHVENDILWRKDGTSFPVEYFSTPIMENQKLLGAVVVFRDISERLRNEAELKSAIEARDEFLSIASHELKTPITSLKLQIQILLRDLRRGKIGTQPPERILKIASLSDIQISRLSRLVDSLLDVSRISVGHFKLNVEEVDLCGLFEDTMERLRPQFSAAHCPFEFSCEKILPRCFFDRLRIEQVITNLLTNAVHYAPGTKIKMSVWSEKDSVLFAVQDEGPGISRQDQERIFSRFERASSNQMGGLGLGLFISKQIVEAHEGRIWVESELDKGTKFIVKLPARKVGGVPVLPNCGE